MISVSTVARTRSEIYKSLALCYYEPSKELVKGIRNGSIVSFFKDSFQELGETTPDFDEGIKILSFEKEKRNLRLGDFHLNLVVEYNRLFVGPGHLPAPPYESVYRKDAPRFERGLVMGESTIEVGRKYREAGLRVSNRHADLPDHMGTELEFMYFLTRNEAEAREQDNKTIALGYLEKQKEFLKDHLIRWVPGFCVAVARSSKLDFYEGIAMITKAHIALEWNRLK